MEFFYRHTWSLSIVRLGCPPPTRPSGADTGLDRIEELRNAPCPGELRIMSRRAKKQHSDRAPRSGTRSSQRKQRRKGKPVLVVVPNAMSSSSALTTAPAAAGAVEAAPASPSPSAAKPAAEPAFADEALPEVELTFFEGWSALAPDVSAIAVEEPSPLITDDVDSLRLTPEQQQRRQWFRRQVTALMAGMGAFGTAAIAVRIASLL